MGKAVSKICIGLVLVWVLGLALRLGYHATQPIDTILVLGGSINREIYGAKQHLVRPDIPILISGGSAPPCLYLLFEQYQAPFHQVWLEPCAQSTFGNFWYTIPLLKQWGVQKVELVSSGTHYARAVTLGRILLGAQGIWVQGKNIEERGVPGNQEYWWKTVGDVSRAMIWAIGSQVYSPTCSEFIPLQAVDLEQWYAKGFSCEHQAELNWLNRQ